MDSMILWYDIKKQGATNENMAENPVLRDLSGNGHDATCYNFAWTEESGISTTNYPNALVSNGVNNYITTNDNIAALSDFTIIYKREIISNKSNQCFCAKGYTIATEPFILDYVRGDNKWKFYSFRRENIIENIINGINVITPIKYNNQNCAKGAVTDEDSLLYLLSRNESSMNMSCALYYFILFDRTLTTEEIEWVKQNLIEGTYRVPKALLIDAWIFSGHTNEEAPTYITGEKGTPLNCYNFAWNEEGSGFKDGALCFDKVDDYLINENMPLLDDFTVIMRRTASGDAGAVVYKGTGSNYNIKHSGAFQLEILYKGGNQIVNYLFNKDVSTEGMGQITTKDEAVSFTPTSIYKGLEYEQNFERVSKEDGPILKINSPLYGNNYYAIKMKYFALYSKTLTDEEIQSEKQRLNALWESRKQ